MFCDVERKKNLSQIPTVRSSWNTETRLVRFASCLEETEGEKKKSVERRINKYVAGYIGASVKRRERKKDVFNTHKCNVRSIYIYI